ncbi:MAG: DNA-deoxyinosine glycosylase [Chromatiales bacterium]|nr:DNA-deoxyinosine glycosylase [Chromatiales bacterium]
MADRAAVTVDEQHAAGFPPVARADARILILGTMPGRASLAAGRYYAYPHNAFWPIMGELLGFDSQAGYATRCAALRKARIALWDVLASCQRPGSLDADIDRDSIQANDFADFFQRHRAIRTVFFNGVEAERLFTRHVLRADQPWPTLKFQRLPSTSPANASVSRTDKLAAWSVIRDAQSGKHSTDPP